MECIYCKSTNNSKNGYSGGIQRYYCKDCKRNWTALTKPSRGYGSSLRFQAVKLYLEGLGFRAIGRVLGVSNVTVLKWIRSMGEKLFQEGSLWKNTDIQHVPKIQVDEFWHYVKKKDVSFGYGLLYVAKQNKCWPFFVVNKPKHQRKSMEASKEAAS